MTVLALPRALRPRPMQAGVRLPARVVVLLGLPRSGTTFLGRLMADWPGAAYLEEPNSTWRYRNFARLGHDGFTAADATPEIVNYIRTRFARASVGASVLIEKTPTNVLRPAFVVQVLPEARFVLLTRDRAEVERSIRRRVTDGYDANARRLGEAEWLRPARIRAARLLRVPPADLPAYLPLALAHATGGRICGEQRFWGPRPPGWQDWAGLPAAARIARQCDAMQASLAAFLDSTRAPVFHVAYADLAADPLGVSEALRRRLEL